MERIEVCCPQSGGGGAFLRLPYLRRGYAAL